MMRNAIKVLQSLKTSTFKNQCVYKSIVNNSFKSNSINQSKGKITKPRKITIWPVDLPKPPIKKVGISISEPYRRIKPLRKKKFSFY